MLANLSIVLDKDNKVRLDLLKNVELSEIDKYTVGKDSSNDIREEYQKEIALFLKEHKEFIDTFKREANKNGSLVIVYTDENKKLHKMRVLYSRHTNKIEDVEDKVLSKVCNAIRDNKNPKFTIDLMEHFSFFLGSPFDVREINKVKYRLTSDERISKNQNQRLLNIIRNHLKYAFERNYEKGYFYLRLIDAYLEKKGLETTKRVVKTSKGTIKTSKNIPVSNTKIVKEKITKEIIKEEIEDIFYMEEDGQYNLFVQPQQQSLSYERYLEEDIKPTSRRKK